jgi:Protein of unknown function DUF262/Protein of unknown function (DUF1524)
MLERSNYMEARTLGIGQLLAQRRLLRVPDHQRDYAWNSDDEVEQFLDDVERSIRENAVEYFLGLVVMVQPRDGQGWQILDGQQRLATTTMVYAGIREWLFANGFDHDAGIIQTEFIGVQELGQTDDHARVTLNVTDGAAFRDLVVNRRDLHALETRRDAAGRYSSVKRLIEAAITCRRRVADFAAAAGQDPTDQSRALFSLANYLRDRVTVVVMDVASDADAYTIFESLNDRGLDLSVLDLIKNQMFGRAGTHLDEVKTNWARMAANLGDRESDAFLKVFWTSKFGRIQKGRLFEEWRGRYDVPAGQIVALSEELARNAEWYAALATSDHDVWADHTGETRRLVRVLAILGSQQMQPVMLAALRSDAFNVDRMETLLRYLVTLTVRYQTIGKGRTGRLEITGARVAYEIATGSVRSPAAAWRLFSGLVPAEEDFRTEFARFVEPKAPRARYLLSELERAAFHRRENREWDLAPWEGLTLEHVLPQNPSNEWQAELAANAGLREQVNRLGNLCLLRSRPNRSMGSAGFDRKKAGLYATSDLLLTRELAEVDVWGEASIEARQHGMADLAADAWPVPTT